MSVTTTLLKALHSIAPQRAGRIVYDRFCTPPPEVSRNPVERRALETLGANTARAIATHVTSTDATIQIYRWPLDAGTGAPRVLLVHGWSSDARVMTMFVEPLRRAGFEPVAIDLPAHGRSTGTRLNMPIGARAIQAAADACGPFHGIIAHSFGGLAAAHALEGGAPLTRRTTTDRLVLIATPHSLSRLVADFARTQDVTARVAACFAAEVTRAAGRPVTSIATGSMLRAAGQPALVVQDVDDDIVPASDGPAIVAAAPNAVLHATRGLGHSRIIVTSAVVRGAVRFLKGETE